jgi:Uma2 family endonuclease
VSTLSSIVAIKVAQRLANHNDLHDMGWILGSEALYCCFPWKPNLVRKPDVSFVRRDRLAPEQLTEGFVTVAPDLAVEVISPNDLASELERKLREYRRAGVRMIWVIDPENRSARIHRADSSARDLLEDGELDGEDVLPGFRCRLGDLLPAVPQAQDE